MKKIEIYQIVETAILTALAVILQYIASLIPFINMPQGGSVSLSMLPIMVIAMRHGVKFGLMGGLILGILNWMMDGYFYHWGSIFFDYIFSGMVLAVAGFFKAKRNNPIFLGIAFFIGGFLQYLCRSLSGVLFFSNNADGQAPFYYSFIIYNLPYMLVSTVLVIAVGILMQPILFKDLEENNKRL